MTGRDGPAANGFRVRISDLPPGSERKAMLTICHWAAETFPYSWARQIAEATLVAKALGLVK